MITLTPTIAGLAFVQDFGEPLTAQDIEFNKIEDRDKSQVTRLKLQEIKVTLLCVLCVSA